MTFYEPLVGWSRWVWPVLANHLWQATLFSLLVLAVASPLKRAPARVRYSLWLLAMIKFVLPAAAVASMLSRAGIDFNSTFSSRGSSVIGGLGITPLLSPVSAPPAVFYAVERAAPSLGPAPIYQVVLVQGYNHWYDVLTLIWLVGCVLLFGAWLRNRRALNATLRAGRIVRKGREWETLERVRSWLGLRRKVTLVVSPNINEPGVWRIFKPVVLLPEGISDRLTDSELEAVMLHEMVHVERWDNLVSVLQRVICCVLWFHPFVWLLDRQLLAEREQSCDDTVIKLSGASKVYASSITKVCQHSLGWAQPGLSSAAGSNLKRRIKRIMAVDVKRSLSISHFALLCAVAVVLFALSAVVGAQKGEQVAQNISPSGVDPRFVVTASADSQVVGAATTKPGDARLSALRQSQDLPQQIIEPPRAVVQVTGESDLIAPPGMEIIAGANQPGADNLRPQLRPPTPEIAMSAAFIPAAATQVDVSQFVGRYEVDPSKVENFVLDITLERGELWLKPSHANKRKLLLTAETHLTDVFSDFRFTGMQDKAGRIVGLRLDSWSSDITARKLNVPQPSLNGNTTFRLSGYADARIVAVAGSFNKWNQSQFLFARVGGEWICRVNLPPGKYEYKFIVDGNWLTDPRNPKTEQDERGNENSVLVTE